jgi:polysaccharide biosynthesis/export protein
MRIRHLWGLVVVIAAAATASAQSTTDPLQALKDTLQQGSGQGNILQDVLGDTQQTGKKTDKKLENPQPVMPPVDDRDITQKDIKTKDGRILRQYNQDPELRPDDSVMLEIRSVDEVCDHFNLGPNAVQNEQANGGTTPPNPATPGSSAANNPLSALAGAAGAAGLGGAAGAAGGAGASGLAALSGVNGIGGLSSLNQNNPNASNANNFDLTRCPLATDKPKTDEEKTDEEKFRKRILETNPYKLNKFGVLELPGLPAMPLSGLTASEATKRLSGDPDLGNYFVHLTLLRATPAEDENLKQFGYDLFEGVPSTFAPVSDIQVPADYRVGAGDTVIAQLYGNEPQTYELTVQRDGRINFPKIGPIEVGDLTFDDARATIERVVAKQLIGTRVSVTMGELRSIRVFVLGEAEKSGSYTVNGLSTMTNALFVSGGVKKIGSLRNIQLKRDGRLVSTLDLYDLLLHGDTSNDRHLLPGDVIFIPPIGPTAAVYGAVRRPAIYELKNEKTIHQAIELAGGLLPDADASLVQVESILPSRLRQMQNVDLSAVGGSAPPLENGDKILVPRIRPTLENSVKLSGYVFRPGAFAYHSGMRLTDVLQSFAEVRPEADLHYILIHRIAPPELKTEVLSADLTRALAAPQSAANPELRPRDEITVFNLSSSRTRFLEPILRDLELQATPDKPQQVVTIDGRVKVPGKYPLEAAMQVSDLIRAGGSLEDAAYRGQAEITRYAVVNGDVRRTDLIVVDLAAIRRGDRAADIKLQPYDTLVIKPIPMWEEPGVIEVAGEVRFPGKYPIHQGETLHSLLVRAGGFDDVAFPEGAVFLREELKKREKDELELLANRLQSDLTALSLQVVASSALVSGGGGGATAAQGLIIGQQLMAQLHNAKPVGRLVINAMGAYKGPVGGEYDVLIKDGDKLMVPKKTQDITILGEVQSPTSHVFQPGLSRDDYIRLSGGTTQHADRKRIYIVHANGDVATGQRTGWFRRSQDAEVRAGDTIVVPLNTTAVPVLPLVQAITTIIYNLAIGFILIHDANP